MELTVERSVGAKDEGGGEVDEQILLVTLDKTYNGAIGSLFMPL